MTDDLREQIDLAWVALDRIAHHPITQSSDAVTLRQIARDALDAALGDQDTTVTTTYGTENPVRKPKHLTHLGEQDTPDDRCATGHPADAVMWNPWNRVVQCHHCGEVVGEQDTEGNPADRCPTCGSDDPTRQQGLPHTDLHAQVRCRDPWHAVPSVEGNP